MESEKFQRQLTEKRRRPLLLLLVTPPPPAVNPSASEQALFPWQQGAALGPKEIHSMLSDLLTLLARELSHDGIAQSACKQVDSRQHDLAERQQSVWCSLSCSRHTQVSMSRTAACSWQQCTTYASHFLTMLQLLTTVVVVVCAATTTVVVVVGHATGRYRHGGCTPVRAGLPSSLVVYLAATPA